MPAKTQVFLVQPAEGSADDAGKRLIRGTRREVEAMLLGELSIEPCTLEQAHTMADVVIEQAVE